MVINNSTKIVIISFIGIKTPANSITGDKLRGEGVVIPSRFQSL